MIRAVFFDIDGTLVSFRTHEIPLSAYDAIAALRRKGIKVFIATGRPVYLIKGLRDAPFDGCITVNGGCCIADGKEIFCNPIPPDELAALVRHERQHAPYSYAFMTTERVITNRITDRVVEVSELLDLPVPPEADMLLAAEQERVLQINLYTDEADEPAIMASIPCCQSIRWSPIFTDIIRRGNNKQTGIDTLLRHYGIRLDETMAFGDGGNDIPMLRHAAVGIAMGNASDAVKQAADYVTSDVDDEGIARALSHFDLL